MKKIKYLSLLLILMFLFTGCGKTNNDTEDLTYKVSFDSNGGSTISSQTIESGKKAKKPNNPVRDGYQFIEWQLNEKTYDFNNKVTSDITLKAIWSDNASNEYTIIFDSNGGSEVPSQTIESGKKAAKPSNPTRDGYQFVEWQLNGEAYNFDNTITSSITLKAVWSNNTSKKYIVKFDSNGGSAISSQTIESGKKATKPSNPTRDGYQFIEWQLNGKTYNFNNTVNSNITLKASWKKNEESKKVYTVTFKGEYIGETKVKVESGKTVSKPSDPKPINAYRFIEWQLNESEYDFNTPINSDITLIAKYNLVYTVRFDSTGGSEVPSQEFIYGNYLNEPIPPIKEGYKFLEWQLNGRTWRFNQDKPGGEIVLKALWMEEVQTVTVTFYSYGSVKRTITLNKGETIGQPPQLSGSGQFVGWVKWNGNIPSSDPSIPWCGMPYDFNDPINEDSNFVACWVTLNQ